MSELTDKMGMTSTSIYNAYGSKRGLFNAVLDKYDERRATFFQWINSAESAREVAERAIFGIVDAMTSDEAPQGCLLLQGGVSCAASSGDVPSELARRRRNLGYSLIGRFKQAQDEGDLDRSVDVAKLANYISLVWDGIGIQAAAGVPRDQLMNAADVAVSAMAVFTQPST